MVSKAYYEVHMTRILHIDEKHLSITGNVVGNQTIKGLLLIILTELLHRTDGAHEYT